MPSEFVTASGRKSSALHLATPARRSQSSRVLDPAAEDETSPLRWCYPLITLVYTSDDGRRVVEPNHVRRLPGYQVCFVPRFT